MYGLGEIKNMNRAVADLPQTKREVDFRVQRDRLGQVLRKLLATNGGATRAGADAYTVAEDDALKALVAIYGK